MGGRSDITPTKLYCASKILAKLLLRFTKYSAVYKTAGDHKSYVFQLFQLPIFPYFQKCLKKCLQQVIKLSEKIAYSIQFRINNEAILCNDSSIEFQNVGPPYVLRASVFSQHGF